MRFSCSPATVVALVSLFFALGGTAFAVSEAVRPQARCQPGAVRGFAAVNGDPANGIANVGGAFTSAKVVFGVRFNCTGPAPQVRRVDRGVYEIRFPGNGARVAAASALDNETTVGFVNGVFRVRVWVPGRQDAIDAPFTIAVF